MLEEVHEVAILVASVLALAIGTIWYSPLVCGRQEAMEEEFTKSKLIKPLLSGGVAFLVFFSVVALVLVQGMSAGYSFFSIASVFVIFFLAAAIPGALWEGRPIRSILIYSALIAVLVYFCGAVIVYWPW